MAKKINESLNSIKILREIEARRKEIRKFGVKKLVLIGSYANNTAHGNSDIDLLVEFKEGRGLFDDYVHLSQFLRGLFKKEVDIGDAHLIRDEIKQSILGGKKFEAKIC